MDTTLKRVHRSFANFFEGQKAGRRVGFPRFKGARRWDSFSFRDAGNCLDGRYFKAGKLCGGRLRVVLHRPLEGVCKGARIVRRPSGWYLQCVCEMMDAPLPVLTTEVGLDMGITYLVADSTGHLVHNPKHLKANTKRMVKAQQAVSRRKKGSNRRRKAVRKLARLHEHSANQRKDTLHKISRTYVNTNQVIAVEDLQPANMVRNHSLARAIMDASWGMLRAYLAYKAEDAGRQFVAVPPHYTSQRCSRCREMVLKSLSVRTHVCPHCGYVADRDTNAAQNILASARLARTEPSASAGEGLLY